MRKFFGFFVLMAGIAFGAFAYFPSTFDPEARLAQVTTIVAAPAGDMQRRPASPARAPEATGSLPAFAPRQPMVIVPTPKPAQRPQAHPLDATAVAANPSPPSAPARAAPITNGWQAVVTSEKGSVPAGVTSSKPGDGHARYELVLDIQRELKRAGCYGGTLSGSWSAITKRAMASFMERVNATLPIEDPDYILLTLIKGQANATCVSCPLGQSLSDGRCVPNAIIAQSQRKTGKTDTRKPEPAAAGTFTTSTAVAAADAGLKTTPRRNSTTPPPPLPGRMAIGGPRLEAVAPAPSAASERWNVRIVPSAATAAADKPAARVRSTPHAEAPARTAALEVDDTDAVAVVPADRDEGAAAPVETGAVPTATVPAAGLPGTKSGQAATGTPGTTRPSYVAPRPQRAARPVPKRQRAYSRRGGSTRSVQNFFMHPLGRM
ncbi:MAG: hypothetical protein ACT4N2_04705 [Hyphomicrobium sp.]